MSKYYLIVHGYDSGLNELLDGKMMRYDYKRKKYYFFNPVKEKNDKLCRNALLEAQKIAPVKIKTPIVIHYLFCVKDKAHDRSNTQAAFIKSFEDAMQQVGLIHNDGYMDVIGSTTDFIVDREKPRVIVCIEEVKSEQVFWKGWEKNEPKTDDPGPPKKVRTDRAYDRTKQVRSDAVSSKNKRSPGKRK